MFSVVVTVISTAALSVAMSWSFFFVTSFSFLFLLFDLLILIANFFFSWVYNSLALQTRSLPTCNVEKAGSGLACNATIPKLFLRHVWPTINLLRAACLR